MKYEVEQLKTTILDLPDMHGALSGGPDELYGYGIDDNRLEEIWELGQELLKEREDLKWT